jgi:hypothetical protein
VSKEEITPENLLRQLNGFLEEFNYPKGKDAIKAKRDAESLYEFISETFEIKGENK